MPRWFDKPDSNLAEIVQALRAAGVGVIITPPLDLLCGFKNRNYLLECKTATGKVRTKKQRDFFDTWPGQKALVRTPDQALDLIIEDGDNF